MLKKNFLILLPFIFICLPVFADTIYLKNGNKMEGVILEEKKDKVSLQVKIGAVILKHNNIEKIDRWSKEENQALEEKWLKQKEKRKKLTGGQSKIRQKKKEIKKKIIPPLPSKEKKLPSKDAPYKDLLGKATLREVTSNFEQSYYLYLPGKYSSSKKWPLFIGVHAYSFDGRQGLEFWENFADREGFILVCPSFIDGYQWLKYDTGRQMIDIIEELKEEFNIDEDKILMAGFSAGAQFTHRFVFEYPEYVQAASIMGTRDYTRPYYSSDLEDIKFLVMVGEDDEAERIEATREFAGQLKDEDYQAQFKSFPGVGHWVCEGEKNLTIDLFRELMRENK